VSHLLTYPDSTSYVQKRGGQPTRARGIPGLGGTTKPLAVVTHVGPGLGLGQRRSPRTTFFLLRVRRKRGRRRGLVRYPPVWRFIAMSGSRGASLSVGDRLAHPRSLPMRVLVVLSRTLRLFVGGCLA
jgi:hypothetical protein